ncbi:MAG: hypothetical protein GY801_34885 [bacterium]|nr:hypothetical protein [bacterium]
MLQEYEHVRQVEGEGRRRWFSDEFFDLIVWEDDTGTIIGFQVCYDAEYAQRALTWRRDFGYTHHRVDDGEHRPGKAKATPVLVADGLFDRQAIAAKFAQASSKISQDISRFVLNKLLEYPEAHQEKSDRSVN